MQSIYSAFVTDSHSSQMRTLDAEITTLTQSQDMFAKLK